jgi:hypothetical protein
VTVGNCSAGIDFQGRIGFVNGPPVVSMASNTSKGRRSVPSAFDTEQSSESWRLLVVIHSSVASFASLIESQKRHRARLAGFFRHGIEGAWLSSGSCSVKDLDMISLYTPPLWLGQFSTPPAIGQHSATTSEGILFIWCGRGSSALDRPSAWWTLPLIGTVRGRFHQLCPHSDSF